MIRGYESGSISEAFGVGTAAAVANITSITHKDQKLKFKLNENGLAEKLKTVSIQKQPCAILLILKTP